MREGFDLKSAVSGHTKAVRTMLHARNEMYKLLDRPERFEVTKKMQELGLLNLLEPLNDAFRSVDNWELQNEALFQSLPNEERDFARSLVTHVKKYVVAQDAATNSVYAIQGGLGKISIGRTELLTEQLQNILSTLMISEGRSASNGLTNLQQDLVASHVSDLVTNDLSRLIAINEADLKMYKVAPTPSLAFLEEIQKAVAAGDKSLLHFVTELQKDIMAIEKPPGNPRNWIIGGAIAAVVAVGAWMAMANNQKNHRAESPAAGKA